MLLKLVSLAFACLISCLDSLLRLYGEALVLSSSYHSLALVCAVGFGHDGGLSVTSVISAALRAVVNYYPVIDLTESVCSQGI